MQGDPYRDDLEPRGPSLTPTGWSRRITTGDDGTM